jgi:hypothetical protein
MTAQLKQAPQKEAAGPFVLNLCSSTTPMALVEPEASELKRFDFFVSRRREEGRERFRLHMGYFMTLAEAEEWLNVVRDIYPGAWAGEAPGKNLAQKVAAVVAPRVPADGPVAEAPAASAVPTVHPVERRQVAAAPVIAVGDKPKDDVRRPAAVARPVQGDKARRAEDAAPRASQTVAAKPARHATPDSNVREVLKSLDDTGHTRLMPSPVAQVPAPAAAAAPAAKESVGLSDTGVLRILEDRRSDSSTRAAIGGGVGIALLRPDDTATCRALKDAVRDNTPVSFAVQLQWSVQPVNLSTVPPLAIFSAYTLYTVEGSRDGRKWFGLRLGFFGDAISAKQVASYVRSEFKSVAVVPVSAQERDRATVPDAKAAPVAPARPAKAAESRVEEFKLIDESAEDVVPPGLAAAQTQLKPAKAPRPAAKPAATKPAARKKALGKVRAHEKRSPQTLEETLEILGASALEIDNGRGELLNDSGVRHLRVEPQKNSPFSRLLDRLSERVRKS